MGACWPRESRVPLRTCTFSPRSTDISAIQRASAQSTTRPNATRRGAKVPALLRRTARGPNGNAGSGSHSCRAPSESDRARLCQHFAGLFLLLTYICRAQLDPECSNNII